MIVVFFKDPKQILLEYKARRMEFENGTNGCHGLAPEQLIDGRDATPSPDSHLMAGIETKVHVDLKQPAADHPEFYFGNGDGNGDLHSAAETIASSETASNGDDKLSDHHFTADNDEHDDFGPETDVDATDEALSPVDQASGVFISSEVNVHASNDYDERFGYQFIEKAAENDDMAAERVEHLVDETLKKNENDFIDDVQNRFIEDNRLADSELSHEHSEPRAPYQRMSDEDEMELNDKIDFSEKKEYSFEREDFDKENEPSSEFANAVLSSISKEAAVAAADDEKERDEDDDDGEGAEIVSTVEQQSECFSSVDFLRESM